MGVIKYLRFYRNNIDYHVLTIDFKLQILRITH